MESWNGKGSFCNASLYSWGGTLFMDIVDIVRHFISPQHLL